MDKFTELLNRNKLTILDGAMATELEARGCDINDELWSAKMLAEKPEMIEQVHYDYYEVGADIGIAASYQASVAGFMKKGYTREESEGLVKSAVEILLKAKGRFQQDHPERDCLIAAAAIGPYGAYLADGSEYRGDYAADKETIYNFHNERMCLLAESGAEMFACETLPCLWEAEIILEITKKLNIPCWFSFSCKDEKHICDGTPISECAKRMDSEDIVKAIGVNCTNPIYISGLIKNIKEACSKPVIVYPNKGEEYDAVKKIWLGAKDGKSFGEWTKQWYNDGAAIIGGCCRTNPEDIAQVKEFRDTL
ncbi:MAG: homocysteine S-methyltransferase [Clostridiales bacterium]|nr:homocysteine S-methyltransferase [Clostridiales bacterium]